MWVVVDPRARCPPEPLFELKRRVSCLLWATKGGSAGKWGKESWGKKPNKTWGCQIFQFEGGGVVVGVVVVALAIFILMLIML